MADDNRGWHGDSQGHAQAGSQSSGHTGDPQEHKMAGKKGGKAQGKQNNPGNFANRPQEDVEDAARKGGQD